jgi:hypothetical protein
LIYDVDEWHYCVANMPGAVARALTCARRRRYRSCCPLAQNKGWRQAWYERNASAERLNVHAGQRLHTQWAGAEIDVLSPNALRAGEKARLLWAALFILDDYFRAARMLVKVLPARRACAIGWNVCFCFFLTDDAAHQHKHDECDQEDDDRHDG